jgi:hypothetical protein
LYDLTEETNEYSLPITGNSILMPFKYEIEKMLMERSTISEIFKFITSLGYSGSYSLLQQYTLPLKPIVSKTKKLSHSVSRRDMASKIWKAAFASEEMCEDVDTDIDYMRRNFPEYIELENIIKEFRASFSNKDFKAIERWADTYSDCKYQSIKSFINGIKLDSEAFYNSLKYEYNNGLLEGFVNKLKEVKRNMYGRASYALLRAKMLLSNKSPPST